MAVSMASLMSSCVSHVWMFRRRTAHSADTSIIIICILVTLTLACQLQITASIDTRWQTPNVLLMASPRCITLWLQFTTTDTICSVIQIHSTARQLPVSVAYMTIVCSNKCILSTHPVLCQCVLLLCVLYYLCLLNCYVCCKRLYVTVVKLCLQVLIINIYLVNSNTQIHAFVRQACFLLTQCSILQSCIACIPGLKNITFNQLTTALHSFITKQKKQVDNQTTGTDLLPRHATWAGTRSTHSLPSPAVRLPWLPINCRHMTLTQQPELIGHRHQLCLPPQTPYHIVTLCLKSFLPLPPTTYNINTC